MIRKVLLSMALGMSAGSALAADLPKVRFLDASTAHRTNPEWVYGLPELHKGKQRAAVKAAKARITAERGAAAQGDDPPGGDRESEGTGDAPRRKVERPGVDDEAAGNQDDDEHEQGARTRRSTDAATEEPEEGGHSPSAASAAASTSATAAATRSAI